MKKHIRRVLCPLLASLLVVGMVAPAVAVTNCTGEMEKHPYSWEVAANSVKVECESQMVTAEAENILYHSLTQSWCVAEASVTGEDSATAEPGATMDLDGVAVEGEVQYTRGTITIGDTVVAGQVYGE